MISKNDLNITTNKFLLLYLNQKKGINVHAIGTLILKTMIKPLKFYDIRLSDQKKLNNGY